MARAEEEIDRLFSLPLDEFTAARDALARSLRADGSRDDAAEVKRLRKPNLVAWALNRVRHERPDRVEALLEAGRRLQEAQRQLVSGGERGQLRSAAGEERSLVEEMVELAEAQLAGAGHPPNPATQSKLFSTVHAAAVGSEAAGLLRAGRLVHEYELSDLGLPAGGVAPGRAPTRERAGRSAPKRGRSAPKRDQAGAERKREAAEAERKRRALAAQVERARARVADLERKADEAQTRANEAAQQLAELEASLRDAGGPL